MFILLFIKKTLQHQQLNEIFYSFIKKLEYKFHPIFWNNYSDHHQLGTGQRQFSSSSYESKRDQNSIEILDD
jgi:hypothetical protein